MTNSNQSELRRQAARGIASRISQAYFGTGPLAELRRMNPKGTIPGTSALHRLLAEFVIDERWLAGERFFDWVLLVHLLALAAPDLLRTGKPLGEALFTAGFSENRLTQVLEARHEDFSTVLPRMVRFLMSKSAPLDVDEIAALVLSANPDDSRRRIARSYYRAEASARQSA